VILWCGRTLLHAPLLAFCSTENDFKKLCKQCDVPDESVPKWLGTAGDAATHVFSQDNGTYYVVCMPVKASRGHNLAEEHALLVHEAVHVWQGYRKSIGESEPSSEFEAYSVQSLAQKLFGALDAAKKGKKR